MEENCIRRIINGVYEKPIYSNLLQEYIPANPDAVALDEKLTKEAKELKKKLEKEKVIFLVKSGKDSKMFGTISTKQIRDELQNKGYTIDKKDIITETINSLGFHNVDIKLYKDVIANIKVEIKSK